MSRDKPSPRERWTRTGRTAAPQGALSNDPARPYEGIGHQLRLARENAGQDLEAVANFLRIRPPLLLAIEEGRFEELPGRIYAIGFLRTYSTHLGLDSAAVISAFKAESAAEPRGGQLVFPAPAPDTRLPGGGLMLLALLIAGGAYAGWYYAHRQDIRQLSDVPPPPSVGEAVTPAPGEMPVVPVINPAPPAGSVASTNGAVPSPASNGTESVAGAAGSLPAPNAAPPGSATAPIIAAAPPLSAVTVPATPLPAAGPASDGVAMAPPPASPSSATPAATEPGAPNPAATGTAEATGQVFGAVNQPARVVLIAHADSWIDIRGAHNEVLFPGRVLHSGDSYRVPNRTDALLWTGNLGALEIRVDGKPIPKLGSYGEARRNISLDPARLQAGTARSR